jgi:alpha-galactosidase
LQVGNGELTDSENRAHMYLWAVLNAPLMAGNDLTTMSDKTLALLTHPGIIAIDQDWGGSQGRKVFNNNGIEIWEKPNSDGSKAIAVLNRSETKSDIDLSQNYSDIGAWKDVWSGDLLTSTAVELPPHDAFLLISQ